MEKILKKKILFITQWFDPEPAQKGFLFSKEIKKNNLEVEVLTGFPNYPGGNFYKNFKIKIFKKEKIEGIIINRVILYPSHDNKFLNRCLNYITFAISLTFFGLFRINKPDLIYAYHPPLTVGLAAIILKKFFNIPVVYDIQDIWPDSLEATGMINSKILQKTISIFCNLVYKFSDKIIVLSPGFKSLLIKRGVPARKIEIIYNSSNIIFPTKKNYSHSIRKKDKFHIIFAGNIGKAQSLETVIDTAENLMNMSAGVEFIIIGEGIELKKIKNQVINKKIDNVTFIPRVPLDDIASYLKQADLLLIHLRDEKLFEITIPSKTQSYMSIGKPILMAANGDASDLIKKSKSGICCRPMNSLELTSTILDIKKLNKSDLELMGKNAKNFYNKNLSLSIGVENLVTIFNSLL